VLLLLGKLALYVCVDVFLVSVGDFAVDSSFYGGGILDRDYNSTVSVPEVRRE
jgi:hypothetical protein